MLDDRPEVQTLLARMKERLPDLEAAWHKVSDHWGYEDPIYRFYHQSFKVYHLQSTTLELVDLLRQLNPDRGLNSWFMQVVTDGTGHQFEPEHNRQWLLHTRPILEAFFHARYFLDMAIRYARELDEPPRGLPSGWAALLYLYDLR